MKKGRFLVAIFVLLAVFVKAQDNDPVLMTIDGRNITKSEFERIYKKNNTKDNQVDTKSLEEYLELFINFKLKVIEAEKRGLDTTKSFTSELAGYRKQLAKPYLVDKDIDEMLLKEAYERMQYDVKAAHILAKCDVNATPKDTLAAYEKAIKARKRILDGEAFEKVAKEMSDDPSAADNGGNLGYFTAFQMVYPFESACYNTKPGDISMPIKTSFGYHIIKVSDKRKAMGEVKVAHIMVAVPKDMKPEEVEKAKSKIFGVYEKLKAGEDFAKLAKDNSDDKGTAARGGELPWFGTGRMVPEFESAAFSLQKNGDYTEPIKTSFGWHIIKRIDKKEAGKYEDVKADIKNKISKDERAERSKQAVVARLKKEYNFKEFSDADDPKVKNQKKNNKKAPKLNLEDFYTVITDSIFAGKWNIADAAALTKPLFSIGDSTYNQQDFTKFVAKFNRKSQKMPISEFVNNKFKEFADQKIIKYEEDRLDKKYPDFKNLMSEYHDGILLFELTDKMVWSKAVKDTVGLKEFYEKNKGKYMWDTRYDLNVYECKTDKIQKKAFEMFNDTKKALPADEILKSLNKKDTTSIKLFEKGVYQKTDNNKIVETKINELATAAKVVFTIDKNKVAVIKKLDPSPKSLDEAKGLITADYQTFLEEKWIKELREKYQYKVNRDILKDIK